MFFIVSTGRSGTVTLAQTLSLIDGCIGVHEPAPQLIMESAEYRYGSVDERRLREILVESRHPRVRGSVYCESNQTLSLIIPVLIDVFPQARFVWLIRNGLDQVASAYSKQWYSGHSENHDRYEDCPPLERTWIDGRIEGDRCGDVSREVWQSLDRFGRCCWYWSYVNRLIGADLGALASEHFNLVRLEDLEAQLPELLDWMGLKTVLLPTPKRLNKGKRSAYPWTAWTPEERASFEEWCGPLMDRFYPGWRTSDGTWKGVEYRSRQRLGSNIGERDRIVAWVNRRFARNSTR